MRRAVKDVSRLNYAPGWAPPTDGDDDLDLTRDEHPAMKEMNRAHLVAAGVGTIAGEKKKQYGGGGGGSYSRVASVPPKGRNGLPLSASTYTLGNYGAYAKPPSFGPKKKSATNFPGLSDNNSVTKNPYADLGKLNAAKKPYKLQSQPPKQRIQQAHLPKYQLLGNDQALGSSWGTQSTKINTNYVHDQDFKIPSPTVLKNKGLFDNLPLPRSGDRRDPRHSSDYKDDGLGFGRQFEDMRRQEDGKQPEYRDLDANGKYIRSSVLERMMSDEEEESKLVDNELPVLPNKNFNPYEEWGMPLQNGSKSVGSNKLASAANNFNNGVSDQNRIILLSPDSDVQSSYVIVEKKLTEKKSTSKRVFSSYGDNSAAVAMSFGQSTATVTAEKSELAQRDRLGEYLLNGGSMVSSKNSVTSPLNADAVEFQIPSGVMSTQTSSGVNSVNGFVMQQQQQQKEQQSIFSMIPNGQSDQVSNPFSSASSVQQQKPRRKSVLSADASEFEPSSSQISASGSLINDLQRLAVSENRVKQIKELEDGECTDQSVSPKLKSADLTEQPQSQSQDKKLQPRDPSVAQSQQNGDGGRKNSMNSFIAITNLLVADSNDRGQLQIEFQVGVDIDDTEVEVPFKLYEKDDAGAIARCFRVVFQQNRNWERHLLDYINQLRNDHLKSEST
ncbi:hypothetical protein MP228_003528 [Amoeboaphelidium protococcarum]|nr:hypothetical protein MP228_003528 [Amoeboaphelidium protococcarum]